MSLLLTLRKPRGVSPPLLPIPRAAVQAVTFDKAHYVAGETISATVKFTRAITTTFGAVTPKLVLQLICTPIELQYASVTADTMVFTAIATDAVVPAGLVAWGKSPCWEGVLAGDARVRITSTRWDMDGIRIRWTDGAVTVRQAPLFINPIPSLAVPIHERISCAYGESNHYWRTNVYPDMPFHNGLDFDTDDEVETPCVAAHDGYIIAQTPSSRGWSIELYFEEGGRHYVLRYDHLLNCAFNSGQEIAWNFAGRSLPVSAGDFMGNIGRVPGYDPLPFAHLHTRLAEHNAAGDLITSSLDPAPHFGVAPRTTFEVNSGQTEYTIKLPLLDTEGTLTRQATVREIVTMLTDQYGGSAGAFNFKALTALLSGDGGAVVEGDGSLALEGRRPADGRRVVVNSASDITDAANGRAADLSFTNDRADPSGLSFN